MRPTPAIDKYIAPPFRTMGEKPLLFTLELELLGAPLPIKRTQKIPSNMNLGYVQEILMLAMGWEGYHLKEIRHGNYTYFVRLAGGQDPEPVEGFPQRDSFKYTLGDLLKRGMGQFHLRLRLGRRLETSRYPHRHCPLQRRRRQGRCRCCLPGFRRKRLPAGRCRWCRWLCRGPAIFQRPGRR